NEFPLGTTTDPAEIDLTLPPSPGADGAWPAGVYTVTVALIRPGDLTPRVSNAVAMLLAPGPELPPVAVARGPATQRVSVTLDVHPEVSPAQEARLTLGGDSALADPLTTSGSTLHFELGLVPQGHQWVRLAVDGVESLLVNRNADPPAFLPGQFVTV